MLKSEWLHPWNEASITTLCPSSNCQNMLEWTQLSVKAICLLLPLRAYDRVLNRAYLYDVYAKLLPYPAAMQLMLQLHGIHNYCQDLRGVKRFPESNHVHASAAGVADRAGSDVKGKEERLIPLSSHFESKRITLNPAWVYTQSEFFQEWVQFPRSAHDDALDCC